MSSNATHWDDCATEGGPAHYECALEKIARLTAERDAALADARRFKWWFCVGNTSAFIAEYMRGTREGWSPDQWRAAIDKAMDRLSNVTAR